MINTVYLITFLNALMNTKTIIRCAFFLLSFLIQDIAKYLQQSKCAASRPIRHSEELPRE